MLLRIPLASSKWISTKSAIPLTLRRSGSLYRRNLHIFARQDGKDSRKSNFKKRLTIFNPWLFQNEPEIEDLTPLEETDGWGSDWEEDWDPDEEDQHHDRGNKDPRPRKGVNKIPRDAWLIPVSGFEGIIDRVTFDEESVEERISAEWEANQTESRQAVQAIGFFIIVPLLVGFIISRSIADPIFHLVESFDKNAFAPTPRQKVEAVHKIEVEALRLEMEVALEKIPPISDTEFFEKAVKKAKELNEEIRGENEGALLNVVSDSISGITFSVLLAYMREARKVITQTTDRFVGGLSESAKAFFIILVADIVLGYHSEEGWNALIKTVSTHYGVEPPESNVTVFISVVPVFMDACFKYWIFKGLNRKSPGAAVTLRTMNRH